MNLSKTVAYNTLAQIFSKAITVIFGIVTTALLTNYLGPAGFGEYLFALSYVSVFAGIADWGTVLISVREASRRQNDQSLIFINTIILRFGLSVLTMLLAILLTFFLPLHSSGLQRIVILSSTLILLMNLKASFGVIFQTKLKLEKMALVEFVSSLVTLLFTFLAVKTGGNLYWLINAVILANLAAVIMAIWLSKNLTDLTFKPSWPLIWQIGKEAMPLGGVLVLFAVYNRLDTLILQSLKGSAEVGVYGLSYRIYEVLVLGAYYLTNSLFPILSLEKSLQRFRRIYQQTLDILILAGLVVLVLTLIFAPLAIKIIALARPQEFSQSGPLLQVLGLALFLSYLNHLTGSTIVVLGKQKKYLLISLGVLVFNLVANLIFIPTYSYYAAAWITVFTEGLVFLLTSLMIYQQTKIVPSFISFPGTLVNIIKNRRIFS